MNKRAARLRFKLQQAHVFSDTIRAARGTVARACSGACGIAVWGVTANAMHDGLATMERNTTLVELARTVIGFPGEGSTEDLIAKARKRR